MRVAEVMTRGGHTVPPTMLAAEAWELMRRKGIRHVVVAAGSDVIGVLSDRDAGGRNKSSGESIVRPHRSVARHTTTCRVGAGSAGVW